MPTVGINGQGRFTLNGVATFLIGVSYFDALDWHTSDLDAFQAKGYNLIRIFLDKEWDVADGSESIFNSDGSLHATKKVTVQDLIRAANARGIVVDVVILYADQDGSNSAQWLTTLGARQAAVQNAVAYYAAEPNVFFDLVNEHNGGSFADSENAEMNLYAASAVAGSASAIFSYSSAEPFGDHILNSATNTAIPATIEAELANGIKFLDVHNNRNANWYALSGIRAASIRAYLDANGHAGIPLVFSEENRRGVVNSSSAQFVQAAQEAKANGCAAWIFHTAACFNMSAATLIAQLDAIESATLDALPGALAPLEYGGIVATDWANLPANLTVIFDSPFSQSLDGMWNAGGVAPPFVQDPTAPLSPPWVIDDFLGVNQSGGGLWSGISFPSPQREVFIGTWWKTNADFQGYWSNNNKLFFLLGLPNGNNLMAWNGQPWQAKDIVWYNQTPENNCHIANWFGGCGDGTNQASGWFIPNGAHDGWLTAGSGWHKLETYHKASTTATSQDGVIKIWIDGVLSTNITNANYCPGGFYEFQYNHAWDGQGSTQCFSATNPTGRDCSKEWHHYWDHLLIATTSGVPITPLTIHPASQPAGTVGVAYSGTTCTATGGTGPYTFAASGLPTGVTFSSGGVWGGTPTVASVASVVVTVTDSAGGVGSITYSIPINSGSLIVTPTTLTNAKVGNAYSQQFSVSGGGTAGSPSLTRSTAVGSLVNGATSSLSFGALPAVGSSIIVPIGIYHATTPSCTVSDNQGNTYSRVISQVNGALGDSALELWRCDNVTTSAGTFTVTVTPTAGSGNYLSWQAQEWANLSTSSHVDVSATIGVNSTSVTVGPTSATTQASELVYALWTATASDPNINVTTPTGYTQLFVVQDAQTAMGIECAYKLVSVTGPQSASWAHDVAQLSAGIATFKAAGGTGAAYTFTASGGALPAGMSLNSAGLLSGTPSVEGTYNFVITVVDATSGGQGNRAYSLVVDPADPIINPSLINSTLVWSSVTNADGYDLEVGINDLAFSAASMLPAGTTTATHAVTATGVYKVRYRVRAFRTNVNGARLNSPYSNEVFKLVDGVFPGAPLVTSLT